MYKSILQGWSFQYFISTCTIKLFNSNWFYLKTFKFNFKLDWTKTKLLDASNYFFNFANWRKDKISIISTGVQLFRTFCFRNLNNCLHICTWKLLFVWAERSDRKYNSCFLSFVLKKLLTLSNITSLKMLITSSKGLD